MKPNIRLTLATAIVAIVAIAGPAFCLNHYDAAAPRSAQNDSRIVRKSVIKVHTEHGVITLPGTADNWEAAEHAVTLADSIANVRMVDRRGDAANQQ